MIRRRFRYAPKIVLDYLSDQLPGVHVCSKIPTKRHGPVVQINSYQGPSSTNPYLAWRRLVFACIDDDEIKAAELAEDVRSLVCVSARFAHIGIRDANMVGEPGRTDLEDERVPEFTTTIDVLLREHYPRRAAAGSSHNH